MDSIEEFFSFIASSTGHAKSIGSPLDHFLMSGHNCGCSNRFVHISEASAMSFSFSAALDSFSFNSDSFAESSALRLSISFWLALSSSFVSGDSSFPESGLE